LAENALVDGIRALMKCELCEDCGWCESHPDRPLEGEHACTCGGAGAQFPQCNSINDGANPNFV
jgi:hypothetical protein